MRPSLLFAAGVRLPHRARPARPLRRDAWSAGSSTARDDELLVVLFVGFAAPRRRRRRRSSACPTPSARSWPGSSWPAPPPRDGSSGWCCRSATRSPPSSSSPSACRSTPATSARVDRPGGRRPSSCRSCWPIVAGDRRRPDQRPRPPGRRQHRLLRGRPGRVRADPRRPRRRPPGSTSGWRPFVAVYVLVLAIVSPILASRSSRAEPLHPGPTAVRLGACGSVASGRSRRSGGSTLHGLTSGRSSQSIHGTPARPPRRPSPPRRSSGRSGPARSGRPGRTCASCSRTVALQLGEGQHDPLGLQVVEQVAQQVGRAGGVDVGDRLGRDHHPPDRRVGGVDRVRGRSRRKLLGVGEEQRRVEPVQQQAGDGWPSGWRSASW